MEIQIYLMLEVLKVIANQAEGGTLTAEQSRALIDLLERLASYREASETLITRQQSYVTEATRLYKRYTGWLKPIPPEPEKVMEWLLDYHSGRRQAVMMLEVLKELNDRLFSLGKLDFDQYYQVRGMFLIGLRTQVRNTLAIINNR